MNRLIFRRCSLFALVAATVALLPMMALAQDVGDGTTTPLDSLSTYALWAIVGGAITSGVTALINQAHWKSVTKLGVFLGLCCVTAGVDAYFNRTLNLSDWSRALVFVVASGWTTYLATKGAIKQVEVATTITRDPVK